MDKKQMYVICVKSCHLNQLSDLAETKWRAQLSASDDTHPAWRMLYKLPLPKRPGDLQWRMLHGISPSNQLVSRINSSWSDAHLFGSSLETVFFLFAELLFDLLNEVLGARGVIFTSVVYFQH